MSGGLRKCMLHFNIVGRGYIVIAAINQARCIRHRRYDGAGDLRIHRRLSSGGVTSSSPPLSSGGICVIAAAIVGRGDVALYIVGRGNVAAVLSRRQGAPDD